MQANELRIGNWVKFKNIIAPVSLGDILRIVDGHYAYSPIELTPEILEGCKIGENNPKLNYKDSDTPFYTIYITDSVYLVFCVKKLKLTLHATYLGAVPVDLDHITSLHKLQNFIYFTFNTELQWNRKTNLSR